MSGEGQNMATDGQVPNDAVSEMYQCQTQDARKLVIHDIVYKLQQFESQLRKYDIGGTYNGMEPDIWFYFTTTMGPGYNYLLNLFLIHRNPGKLSIGISGSNTITLLDKTQEEEDQNATLSDSLSWYNFKSIQGNEQHHIKTFCFSGSNLNLKRLENCIFFIPIKIEINPPNIMSKDVFNSIKCEHDLRSVLTSKVKGDFELITNSQTKFSAHKIILCAHSSVLKEIVNNSTSNSEFIDITDNEMKALLEFLYTGTISKLFKQDCKRLLEISIRFKLTSLFEICQYALSKQINETNAIDIAILCLKYDLNSLQTKVFEFIANNINITQTDAWKNLKDKNLDNTFSEYMHTTKHV